MNIESAERRIAESVAQSVERSRVESDAERRDRIREGDRDRKRRQRAREKEERGFEAERVRVAAGMLVLGEIRPGVNYTTLPEGIECSKRWAGALGITDLIQPGSTLTDIERRLFYEWKRVGCPGLNNRTNEFDTAFGWDVSKLSTFDEVWAERVPGCDEPLLGSYPGEPILSHNATN